jgi:hypothetical protein
MDLSMNSETLKVSLIELPSPRKISPFSNDSYRLSIINYRITELYGFYKYNFVIALDQMYTVGSYLREEYEV